MKIKNGKFAMLMAAIRSIFFGAIVWVIVGVGTGTIISGFAIGGYAIWVIHHASPGAAVLGAIQGLWLHIERDRWSTSKQLLRFGALSGMALGLLDFAPSFVQTQAHYLYAVCIFILACLLGGYAAGYTNARFFLRFVRADCNAGTRRRLITACLIFLSLGTFQYVHFAPSIIRKLPIWPLYESSVVNLPPGNAQNSQWGGEYDYEVSYFESSGLFGKAGGRLWFTQDGGRLTVKGLSGMELRGGINSNGKFWAGGQTGTQSSPSTLRTRLTGRFISGTDFICSLRDSVLKSGKMVNTNRADGSGHRVKR